MELDEFWSIIEHARAVSRNDQALMELALQKELLALPAERIRAFDTLFWQLHCASYTWPLWGAAYVMEGGCSDDGFDYFRAWLIAQGRDVFEAALADPDSLADVERTLLDEGEFAWFESLLSAASDAYEKKTGQELAPVDADVSSDATPGSVQPAGDRWEEEDLEALYPKLWARYGPT